jgi:solute carrier family 40 (iron-regulated transporter), member 1
MLKFDYSHYFVGGKTAFATPSFFFLVISSCVMHLSNTTISIAVERDWATCIAQGPFFSTKLSRLNTYLRQINLLCKLCAPLFVSFLTVSFDRTDLDAPRAAYRVLSVKILAIITAASLFFELYWIGVVYKRFPMLEMDQARRQSEREAQLFEEVVDSVENVVPTPTVVTPPRVSYIERLLNIPDWKELVRLPIFFSSLAISLLYLTVLS